MLKRHGVTLSPLQADIFDFIERSPNGIDTRDLASVFYPRLSTTQGTQRLKANMWLIREKLEETTVTIGCIGRNTYKVLK